MRDLANAPTTSTIKSNSCLQVCDEKLMDESCEDILPRVAQGDPAAVSICLDRYGDLVWSLARRSLADRQAAEDAVQEIFLKLWEVADRFNGSIASETTFVSMIARRKLIDINRKRKLPAGTAIELDQFYGPSSDAARLTELKDEAARAVEILDSLPQEQQRVIRLNIFDGLSHSRIAEATGLSLGTVKTNIRRGILKLREHLFPDRQDTRPFDSTAPTGESN